MQRKWLASCLGLVLIVVAASSAPVQAQGQDADTPTAIVRIKSLNALLQNLNLVVRLVGQEEVATQIEGLVKGKIGKDGLEGIDTTRPIGAYVRFGKEIDQITGAILVPIASESAFLNLLDNVGVNYAKDNKTGIYTHKTNKNIDLFFRFANRYLYITAASSESIQDKNLVAPAKALAIDSNATIALVARVDRVPDAAKLFALQALSDAIESAQQKKEPNETKLQEGFRVALFRDLGKLGSSVIREAAEIRLELDIADASKEMTVNFSIAGKPGSDLAKSIADLGKLKSPLAGLAQKDVAFLGAAHLALPATLRKSLNDLIDEAAAKSLANIQDAAKKKQAEALFSALLPTAKSGDFAVMTALFGPHADRYTVLAGLKLKDGVKLGDTVRKLVSDSLKEIPAEFREKITLDVDSVGSVKIHKFDLPKDAAVDKLKEIFGSTSIYLAFRDDALLVAMGQEALPTLKGAIAKTATTGSLPLVFDFDFARMARWTAQTAEQKELAAKLFGDRKDGRVRLSIEGGNALTARLQMRLSVLEYLAKLKKDKE